MWIKWSFLNDGQIWTRIKEIKYRINMFEIELIFQSKTLLWWKVIFLSLNNFIQIHAHRLDYHV